MAFDTGCIGGSVDPDANFWPFRHTGGLVNWSGHSNPAMDTLLVQARGVPDIAERGEIYGKALDIEQQDLPIIHLFNEPVIMAMRRNLECFTVIPDGLMRRKDVRLVN